MPSHFRVVIGSIVSIAMLMILTLGLHIGGENVLHVAIFSSLTGATIAGILIFVSTSISPYSVENREPWIGQEKLAWILVGCGCVAWGIGECFWRYYSSQGEPPFPSLADVGYSAFPPLLFLGLILQPFSKQTDRKRLFLLLDSLIAMGALLSIAWFLLLGPLAQAPTQSVAAKLVGLYYPTSDVALLSCTIFLLLRGTDQFSIQAHRISLLILGLGLSLFAVSDFLFNVLQNVGTYEEGSWVDLGWPLGIMAIGVAAYLRRFLPRSATEEQKKPRMDRLSNGLSQSVPYALLGILFLVLAINVLSADQTQVSIRPVLVVATFVVIALLVARQVATIRENERLMREAQKLAELEAIEIKRQEEELAMSQQIEDGIQHILATLNTVVTRSDFTMRVPLKQENILWRVGRSINNLLSRLQGFKQNQEELRRTHVIALAVAERMRDGLPIQLNSWTGTALDPVIIEYNKRFQNPALQLAKKRLARGSEKP
jgi:hypothetical protein